MGTTDPSKRIHWHIYLAGAAFAFLGFAYVVYALEGWFHQDDFIFIEKFSRSLHFSDLVSLDGFGRFLTQNVYWNVGLAVFGRTSELFFIFNFLTILGTSVVVYVLTRNVLQPVGALAAAMFYFASPRVIHAFAWISNSQHLLAHLLCVLFLVLLFRWTDPELSRKQALALLVTFCLALISNAFALALLAPILWLGATHRRSNPYRILTMGAVVMGLFTFIRSRNSATGAYEVRISLDVLRANAEVYWGSTSAFVVWFLLSLTAAVILWRRHRKIESLMFVNSVAFFAPFAFLSTQRFPQYGVMTLVFFLIGSWMVVFRFITRRIPAGNSWVAVLVILVSTAQGFQEISVSSAEPLGGRARHLVESLRADTMNDDGSVTEFCFDHEPVLTPGGTATNSTPPVWWWVGHGLAFSLFVDGTKSYQLLDDSSDCDRIYFISPNSVYRIS